MILSTGDLVLYGHTDGEWLIGLIRKANVEDHPSPGVDLHEIKWMWGTDDYVGFVGLTQRCGDSQMDRLINLGEFGVTGAEVLRL